MTDPRRPRFGSRPDIPREEPESTPPRGTAISDELARAMRDPPPWWAALILRKLDVDTELRQRDQRIGAIEEMVDSHEDALSSTKVRNRAVEEARAKWGDRVWDLGKTVVGALVIALLVYGASWLHCIPPPREPKIEVKP